MGSGINHKCKYKITTNFQNSNFKLKSTFCFSQYLCVCVCFFLNCVCVFVFFLNWIQICYSCSNHTQDNSLYLQQHIGTENKREKKFIFLKEGPTDITVQTVRKVVRQVSQALLQDLGLIAETRHIQRVVLHRPTVVRKTKTLGFLKAVLLVKIVGCLLLLLLLHAANLTPVHAKRDIKVISKDCWFCTNT